jgi:hypothetical protein
MSTSWKMKQTGALLSAIAAILVRSSESARKKCSKINRLSAGTPRGSFLTSLLAPRGEICPLCRGKVHPIVHPFIHPQGWTLSTVYKNGGGTENFTPRG